MIVEIRNYKTIKHMKFEFSGFASIVGQNFIGKSAVVGAIVSALSNSMDKTSIRDGEDFSEVSFIRGDLDLFWHYEEGNTFYIINGQEYKKLNGGLPPPLVAAGYAPLAVADEKEYLWYIPQFNPLFVVDRDRSNFSTELLATIFKFDSVYKALDLCKKEIREVAATAKLRETDLSTAREALSPVLPLEEVLPRVSSVISEAKSLGALAEEVGLLDSWILSISSGRDVLSKLLPVRKVPDISIDGYQALAEEYKAVSALSSSLGRAVAAYKSLLPVKGLSSSPDTAAVSALVEECAALGAHAQALSSADSIYKKLLPIKKLGPAPVVATVSSLLGDLKVVSALSSRLVESEEEVKALSGVPSISSVQSVDLVASILSGLTKVTELNDRLVASSVALSRLHQVSKIPAIDQEVVEKIQLLLTELGSLSSYSSSLKTAGSELKVARDGLATATAEYDRLFDELSAYKSCPTCGQTLNHEGPTHG